jgi:hypothetical protein
VPSQLTEALIAGAVMQTILFFMTIDIVLTRTLGFGLHTARPPATEPILPLV